MKCCDRHQNSTRHYETPPVVDTRHWRISCRALSCFCCRPTHCTWFDCVPIVLSRTAAGTNLVMTVADDPNEQTSVAKTENPLIVSANDNSQSPLLPAYSWQSTTSTFCRQVLLRLRTHLSWTYLEDDDSSHKVSSTQVAEPMSQSTAELVTEPMSPSTADPVTEPMSPQSTADPINMLQPQSVA